MLFIIFSDIKHTIMFAQMDKVFSFKKTKH